MKYALIALFVVIAYLWAGDRDYKEARRLEAEREAFAEWWKKECQSEDPGYTAQVSTTLDGRVKCVKFKTPGPAEAAPRIIVESVAILPL